MTLQKQAGENFHEIFMKFLCGFRFNNHHFPQREDQQLLE